MFPNWNYGGTKMEQKTDLRIIKTHKALRESLEGLLLEKPLTEITVNEICERAMVRRATFYKHFGDKYELLTFVLKEMKDEIREIKATQDKAHSDISDIKIILHRDTVITLEYIEAKESLFRALITDCSTGLVSQLVMSNFSSDLKEYLTQSGNIGNVNSATSSLMFELLTGALFYGITWWLNHKEQLTKDELAKRLSDFIINVIDGEK